MKNITLSLDESELEAGRKYAQEQGMSLNALIRQLLGRTVRSASENWIEECFELMDQAKVKKRQIRVWKREELYDV